MNFTRCHHLQQRWPQPALTPSARDLAMQAREREHRQAEEIGVALRLWFYSHVLRQRR
ncbi:hypothetical protein [Aquitalea palustris]|uniref:hypothetical protein n=1 Tax=Aquitalea palustris TaxID=2480983 RepID=UPI0013143977|nr:hypothetical protein [Aquitalea palustris]